MRIVDYGIDENGKLVRVDGNANLEILGSAGLGYNAPQIVNLNGVKGFLKNSAKSTTTFDKFEYLFSKLGKFLGVNTADEYIVKDGDNLSTFSKSVTKDDEKLIMASKLDEELVDLGKTTITEIIEKKKNDEVFTSSLEKIRRDEHSHLIVKGDKIDYAINDFINQVNLLQVPNEEEIIKDYIKMCCFDSIIGNKDRNTNNYGLIKSKDGSYRFAPLFDNATIEIPDVSSNLCLINAYYIDKMELLKYLIEKYPEYTNEILSNDLDKIREDLTSISKDILNEKEFEWFNSSILSKLKNENIEIIKSKTL